MSILLVEKNEKGLSAAVMNRGRLYAYQSETDPASLQEEQVFVGVVDRAVKGVNAVFVRLPNKMFGFLPVSAHQKAPASGTRVIVQVRRPPNGGKKALLSLDIAIAGACIVYLPKGAGVRVSSRLESDEQKEALHALGHLLAFDGGIIIRSAALGCEAASLQEELDALCQRWRDIEHAAQALSAPALLWAGEDMITVLLRDEGQRLEYVLTNAPDALPQTLACPIKRCDNPFALHCVNAKLERSLRRTVLMKSGATLVIDPCEAMTVIDVNSAMAAGGRNIEQTAEKINLEACWEIARLLRLRGIGGMVVIDFIDMASEAARAHVMDTLREALREDPVKTTVHDFTALGLLELTRHRAQTPLAPLDDLPCPHCAGSGVSLSADEEDPFHA